jgi:transposase
VKKRDGRTYSHDVLEHYRFQAIRLHKEGRQVNEIAHFFGVHRGSVSRWITAYRRGGEKTLKSTKALGPTPKLTTREVYSVIGALQKPATEHGFDTPLWTCKRVHLIVAKKTGKTLHPSNVWRLLRRWGLTNQKPEKRALQADPKEGERWLREEWPKIKAHAKQWRAIIYFVDEAGVSLVPVLGKTWAPKGKTPIVVATGDKGGFCVTSAISPGGRMLFRIEKEKVNAAVHIQFLRQILRHHPARKVIAVEDQARAHVAERVKEFVEGNGKRFALYYLPPCSPHLNPDEEVWNHLKNRKLRAHQARTKKEFKSVLLSNLWSIQRSRSLVRSFFYRLNVT